MKFRMDFVTNSSSTSYIYKGFYSQDLLSYVIELVRAGYIYKFRDKVTIDPDTLDGLLPSESRKEGGKGIVDDLIFFPYNEYPYPPERSVEKTGFQIAETEFTHSDPLEALLSFINLENASPEDAEAIRNRLAQLVNDAKRKGQILSAYGEGMTDRVNLHFNERSAYKAQFKISGKTLQSYRDRDAIEINSEEQLGDVIGTAAFKDMSRLKTVNIDAGYKEIGEEAFCGCSSLEHIVNTQYHKLYNFEIPRYVISSSYPDYSLIRSKSIRKNAFRDCKSLKAIHFKTNNILASAFESCESLETIEFHDGFFEEAIRKIDSLAFADCINLRDVYFPDDPKTSEEITDLSKADKGIKSISPTAFKNCSKITLHVYEGTYAHKYAVDKGIRYELVDRFPREYLVQKMMIRKSKSRIAESLSLGDTVLIQPAEKPFIFSVFNDKGQDIGVIFEGRLSAWNYINDNLGVINATVSLFTPIEEVRKKYPKENSAELCISLSIE